MAVPEAGSTWRMTGGHPGEGAPKVGDLVCVREIVPADEAGANAFSPAVVNALTDLTHRQRVEWIEAGFELQASGDASTAAQRGIAVQAFAAVPDAKEQADAKKAMAARHSAEYAEAAAPYQVDAIVVEWGEPTPVWDGEGYQVGTIVRAWALSEDEFCSLFEEA